MDSSSNTPLSLELTFESSQAILGERILATVKLSNTSTNEVRINNRRLVGYKDREDREFYCKIENEDHSDYEGYIHYKADYFPIVLTDDNFILLQKSESVFTRFDLQLLYPLTKAGFYYVQVVYSPRPDKRFPDLFEGPIYSKPVKFKITKR